MKQLILAARAISMVFTPFYLPIVGLVALFTFSYMSIFPWVYKLQVLIMVYLFTILLPTVLIHLYRRYQGWSLIELGRRERRMVPYVLSILCYFCCVYIMMQMHIPHFIISIVIAALVVQIVCALINVWWKIGRYPPISQPSVESVGLSLPLPSISVSILSGGCASSSSLPASSAPVAWYSVSTLSRKLSVASG